MACLKLAGTSNVQLIVARKECGSRFVRSPNFSGESKNLDINPHTILSYFTKSKDKLKYYHSTVEEKKREEIQKKGKFSFLATTLKMLG